MKRSIQLTVSVATVIALTALVTKYVIGGGTFYLIFSQGIKISFSF